MVAVKTSEAHLVLTTDPKIDVVDTNVDSILVDTTTTIPGTITTIDGYHDVPTADVATNTQMRDVVGNKTDAAQATVAADKSIMGYTKAILTDTGTTIPGTITTIDGYHDVPTANITDNNQLRDVVGNKTDAAADGAVSATESLMAYSKQNVTNVLVVEGYHNVPGQDVGSNIKLRDVVGNKTDTTAGDSLYSLNLLSNNNQTSILDILGYGVGLAPAAIPQTTATALFTVTGTVKIWNVLGFVTTQIGAVANNMKLVANSTAGTDVDLCATIDVNADDVGTIYSLTGTLANVMVKTAGNGAGNTGALEEQGSKIIVNAGTIDVDCDASDGGAGRVQWIITWSPLSPGATLVETV